MNHRKKHTITLPRGLRERVEDALKTYELNAPFDFFVRLAIETDLRSLGDDANREHIRQAWKEAQ
jgi:hypothetical protein